MEGRIGGVSRVAEATGITTEATERYLGDTEETREGERPSRAFRVTESLGKAKEKT